MTDQKERTEEKKHTKTILPGTEVEFVWEFSGPRILAGLNAEDAPRIEELAVLGLWVGRNALFGGQIPLAGLAGFSSSLGVIVPGGVVFRVKVTNQGSPQELSLSLLFQEDELSEGAR